MSRQCMCYGSNVNCFYCSGTGLIADSSIADQGRVVSVGYANESSSPPRLLCKVCKKWVSDNSHDITVHALKRHRVRDTVRCPYCGSSERISVYDQHVTLAHNKNHKTEMLQILEKRKQSAAKKEKRKQNQETITQKTSTVTLATILQKLQTNPRITDSKLSRAKVIIRNTEPGD